MKPGSSPHRQATVADVALVAGVAKATAARVLGGYGSVSARARGQVLRAAKQLGYSANGVARSMNTGKSRTIGVVVGDIENQFFALAMRGISDTANAAGYDVILLNSAERVDAEIAATAILLEKRVDGLIVAPASHLSGGHLTAIESSGRPLVLLDRSVEGVDSPPVHVDASAASRELASALVQAGHRRIAFVSSARCDKRRFVRGAGLISSTIEERIGAIDDQLSVAGIEWDPELIRLNAFGPEGVDAAIQDLLALGMPPTALLASDSVVASHCLLSMRRRGLTIPGDLSFASYDDFTWTELVTPPLTVVRQPIYEMGVEAATSLLDRLGIAAAPSSRPVLSATLIRRESIGAPNGVFGEVRRSVQAIDRRA